MISVFLNLFSINNFSCFSLRSLPQINMHYLDTFGNNPEYEDSSTQNPLASVYKKVNQLSEAIKMKEAQNQEKIFIKHFAEVPKNNLKLDIDRVDEFIQKRIDGFATRESFGMQTKTTFKKTRDNNFQETKQSNFPKISAKKRSKSERVLKFLKDHRDKVPAKTEEKPQTPELFQPQQNQQRQIFTPMRPISKISGHPESVSGFSGTEKSMRSRSQNRSSVSYSQTARLTHITSSKSSTPGQYLRKGHRVRETLKRQFQNPSGIEQEGQMAYIREYDQWVPAAFVNYKKMELDHFMNIMFGAKKVQQKASHVFEPIYL